MPKKSDSKDDSLKKSCSEATHVIKCQLTSLIDVKEKAATANCCDTGITQNYINNVYTLFQLTTD